MTSSSTPSQAALSQLNWIPQGSAIANFEVDVRDARVWKLGRVWTTAATLRSVKASPGMVRVLLSVDGEAALTIDGERVNMAPGQALVVGADSAVTVTHDGTWARYEWQLKSHLLASPRLKNYQNLAISISKDYYRLLAAIANATIMSDGLGYGVDDSLLLAVFSCAVAAGISAAASERIGLTSSQADLVKRAEAVIEDQYLDPSFDVTALIGSLPVSKPLLYRAFSAWGTTPRKVLEERRAAHALSLMDSMPHNTPAVMQAIAERSGFTSVRQMRMAIARRSDDRSIY